MPAPFYLKGFEPTHQEVCMKTTGVKTDQIAPRENSDLEKFSDVHDRLVKLGKFMEDLHERTYNRLNHLMSPSKEPSMITTALEEPLLTPFFTETEIALRYVERELLHLQALLDSIPS